MWLQLADAEESKALLQALEEMLEGQPAAVHEEQQQTLTVLWAEGEVDEGGE